MKKQFPFFVLLLIFSVSCRETWTRQTTGAFYDACTDEAVKWAGTPERAKAYCDCVFAKMVAKYPHEIDALEHIDSLAMDPDLIGCREEMTESVK